MIAEVMDKVGKDGVVTVEEGQGLKLDIEYVEGMQLDRGYLSAYFVAFSGRRQARGLAREPPTSSSATRRSARWPTSCPTLEKVVSTGHAAA